MSFYSAFPSSPLSRSALATDRSCDRADSSTKPPNQYGQLSSMMFDSPRQNHPSLRGEAAAVHFDSVHRSPLGPAAPLIAQPSSRHVSGPARLMRNPFSPTWSSTASTPFDDASAVSPPMPSSSFARSINTRRRSSVYSNSGASPTPKFGSLVGSFQESLLSGRMSMPASKPLIFDAEIGVLGMGRCKPSLRCPPHVHVKFPAHFYDFHAIDAPATATNMGSTAALGSPYVGTIDLEAHYHNTLLTRRLSSLSTSPTMSASSGSAATTDMPSFPGYAVPPKGQVQLIVKYPDLNAVKLFLVPYDLTDMQPGTKTFVRQKTIVRPAPNNIPQADEDRGSPSATRSTMKEPLRFAIHLQFCCPPTKPQHDDHQAGFDGLDARRQRGRSETQKGKRSPKIYLHKSIRLVFGARALDSGEKLIDQVETPGQGAQRFSTYNGPEEEWLQLHHDVTAAESQYKAASFATSIASPTVARPAQNGLGIAIQASAASMSRCSSNDDENVLPLNSDPNGERWQGGSSYAQQLASLRSHDGPATSHWSLISQESGSGRSRGRQDASVDQQPLRTLSSSHPAQPHAYALAKSTDQSMEPRPSAPPGMTMSTALTPTRSMSPNASATRPARIRSASTTGLSEARVQSVSALGRLEESTSRPDSESVSVDSPYTLRHHWKAGGADRPSLIRKLSEQFARSHTPSPTASPKLRPTRRVAEVDMEHDPDIICEQPAQQVARIR